MKKLLSFILIIFLGGGAATLGKNYFIHQEIDKYSRHHQDRFQIKSSRWDWQGVFLENVQITQKKDPPILIQNIQLSHDWLTPFYLHLKIDQVNGPKIKISSANCSLSSKEAVIFSDDLTLQNSVVTLERHGSTTTHTTDLKIPYLKFTFRFHQNDRDLFLTADVPSFDNEDLSLVSLKGKGKMKLQSHINGRLDLHLVGLSKVIDMLIKTDIIKKKKAMYFSLGAKLLGGANDETDIPLSFDQGSVYLGPFLIYQQ